MLGRVRRVHRYGVEGLERLPIVRLANRQGKPNSKDRRVQRCFDLLSLDFWTGSNIHELSVLLSNLTEEEFATLKRLEDRYSPINVPQQLVFEKA